MTETDLEEIKKQWKSEQRKTSIKKNKCLRLIVEEICITNNFRYCNKGNQNYLNEQIGIILQNKVKFLKRLKNEILGI